MSDPRLPITIKRIPGGVTINLATGERMFLYGRDSVDVARQSGDMTREEAEQLAADVARTLTDAWGKAGT